MTYQEEVIFLSPVLLPRVQVIFENLNGLFLEILNGLARQWLQILIELILKMFCLFWNDKIFKFYHNVISR